MLGLSACVRAFPYSIPEAGPDMLMTLANHVNDPASIQAINTLDQLCNNTLNCFCIGNGSKNRC